MTNDLDLSVYRDDPDPEMARFVDDLAEKRRAQSCEVWPVEPTSPKARRVFVFLPCSIIHPPRLARKSRLHRPLAGPFLLPEDSRDRYDYPCRSSLER